ncbi:MAG TPA: hypothetical protein PKA87_06315 [Microthrixaceae bacterium]|nr:hypothetical protein [Microthrixaceae bacterium]MCB9376158.1 hypothetical protein [Microthrixaceae bacterium]MCB9400635.1 hypothetical protein [Microthrixaceae bacterium]MCO5305094.1 hypothetical protein [Microthrixaceae bacterium]HMU78958.1 hypothetical protein [Microthrixaceae bacterium]
MLALLEERLPADLVVTDPADDRIVALDRAPIEFLAGNQWMFANAYWDSLAAFVQPNSPAIDQVLEATRQLPKDRSGNASTEGFVGSVRSRSDRVRDHLGNMFGEMTATSSGAAATARDGQASESRQTRQRSTSPIWKGPMPLQLRTASTSIPVSTQES